MQISSRFTVALHIFTCVDTFKDDYKVTSDFLAGSINTNPVIIRKILTQLKNAGLITVARGTGGITVNRPLSEITFYDVYQPCWKKHPQTSGWKAEGDSEFDGGQDERIHACRSSCRHAGNTF